MPDRLEIIFDLQLKLNDKAGVKSSELPNLSNEQRIQWLKKYSIALLIELCEFFIELGVKWWKPFSFSRGRAREEAIDMFHMLLSILLLLGFTPEELYNDYRKKNDYNHARKDWLREGDINGTV